MKLSDLLAGLGWSTPPSPADPDITAVVQDSRQVGPGALFVARSGGVTDGHDHIGAALRQGAVAVVGSRDRVDVPGLPDDVPYIQREDTRQAIAWLAAALHGFPARQLVMIGVTGTDGKTTTSNMLYQILRAAGRRAGLISTVNAVIGETVLDTGLHVTTPDPQEVQAYLAQMVAAGLTHCVLETTSHGLAQGRVTACEFDIAVVTNITHEHLDFHGSLQAYRDAKALLFEGLATAHTKPGVTKLAVLNRDDISYTFLPPRIAVSQATYSTEQPADVRGGDIAELADRLVFSMQPADTPPFTVTLPIVGRFNVDNALAAATAAMVGLGVTAGDVQRGLAQLPTIPGRMERIAVGVATDFTVIVDFAHTPNALKQALTAARPLCGPGGRVIVVFGSAGKRDVEKRTLMGEVAGELADLIVVTAEDPRTESLRGLIAASMAGAERQGAQAGRNLWGEPDRQTAIQRAVDMAQAGDVVLICGKAHEQSMCFGEVEHPWDDRVATRAALQQRLGRPADAVPALPTRDPDWETQPWA